MKLSNLKRPAFPFERVIERVGGEITRWESYKGVSKLVFIASLLEDDLRNIDISLFEAILEEAAPRIYQSTANPKGSLDYTSLEYAQWVAKARAKWRLMQARAILEEAEIMLNDEL